MPARTDDEERRRIVGALRQTYEAHGAITPEWFGSATKRIQGALNPEAKRPGREQLPELRLPGKRVIIRPGDYVEVGPSRPNKRDGWTGTIISIFVDRGGPVVEVHHPSERIHRCVPPARVRGRRRTPEEVGT